MKTFFIILIVFASCKQKESNVAEINADTIKSNSTHFKKNMPDDIPDTYSNERFRKVMVTKMEKDSFLVTGEGQIFESSFNWEVEDGHNILLKGYATTDAGAPDWGKLNFTVGVKKERPNSVLHLILYEASAKDGSRQHELLIKLD
jgi:hypothetical protein